MWVLSVEDLNREDGSCSRLFFRTKEDAMKRVTSIVDSAAAHGLTTEPFEDGNGSLHIYSEENPEEADQRVSVYEADFKFEPDPSIVSNVYFYRDSYFLECTHDAKTGIVSVYLYDRDNPEDKYGIWQAKSDRYADDQNVLLAILPDVEPLIEELESLDSEDPDDSF